MIFDNIISRLIDTFRPDLAEVPCPFVAPKKSLPDTERDKKSENIVVYAGMPFEQVINDDGTQEDTRLTTTVTLRNGKAAKGECPPHLKSDKYAELKPVWARGTSAAQAAKLYEKKRGYSLRILQDYWAAFNAFEKES